MAEHPRDAGGRDLETLAATLYRNILITSLTARGQEASKERRGKVRLGITGAALASRVQMNTRLVAEVIARSIAERWSVAETVERIIEATHRGFPRAAREWRKAPTGERWGPVRYQKIPGEVRRFKRGLNQNLDRWDPERLAAWAEWMWDEHIHPLGDGCGRTAKAIGAWVLARRGLELPDYGSREAYLAAIASGLRAFTAYYHQCLLEGLGERHHPKRTLVRELGGHEPRTAEPPRARLRVAS